LRSKKEKEERVESCRVARSMEFERRHEIGRAGQIRWPGTEIRFRYLCTGGGEKWSFGRLSHAGFLRWHQLNSICPVHACSSDTCETALVIHFLLLSFGKKKQRNERKNMDGVSIKYRIHRIGVNSDALR